MGKAMRWLKGFFGLKRDKDNYNNKTMTTSQNSTEFRDNRGSSFGRECSDGLCHNPTTIPPNLSAAEAAWLRSYYTDQTEQEQSKHAIAVAAATAAAADAAMAAAQAAVAVVRLTSHGRGAMFGGGGTSHERWASLKIQTVFRGYLARKALRALKGVVKLQAVVRGYLVRKQATATFHSMQALIRAQATVRSHKTRSLFLNSNNNKFHSQSRKSTEHNNSNSKTEHHSRRLSATLDANFADETPKIVEVDTGRPKSRSRRTNASMSDSDYQMAMAAEAAMSSPLPCRRISIPDNCHFSYSSAASEWGLTGEECRFSTAQSTPRFCGECGGGGRMMLLAPPTPAKSVYAGEEAFFRANHPNYMSSTKSFKAKLRSYSAPKQRPEPGPKKRLSLNEAMESTRSSLSGVRMQRSCSQVQEAITFKNAVMGKIELRDRTV